MRWLFLVWMLLVPALGAAQSVTQAVPVAKVLKTDDLPKGGALVPGDSKSGVRYYLAPSGGFSHTSSLYQSYDSGATWHDRLANFEFKNMLAGSDGKCLYADIRFLQLQSNAEGFLEESIKYKPAISYDEGKTWQESGAEDKDETTSDARIPVLSERPILKGSDLPTSGEFIQHPKHNNLRYCKVNTFPEFSACVKGAEIPRYPMKLYISQDGGETWKLGYDRLQIGSFFIHPETGMLFASLEVSSVRNQDNGKLAKWHSNKIAMSEDGIHWKDITENGGYLMGARHIFPDPENPGRVCVGGAGPTRASVLQSLDANYSKWKSYKSWDWAERTKGIQK